MELSSPWKSGGRRGRGAASSEALFSRAPRPAQPRRRGRGTCAPASGWRRRRAGPAARGRWPGRVLRCSVGRGTTCGSRQQPVRFGGRTPVPAKRMVTQVLAQFNARASSALRSDTPLAAGRPSLFFRFVARRDAAVRNESVGGRSHLNWSRGVVIRRRLRGQERGRESASGEKGGNTRNGTENTSSTRVHLISSSMEGTYRRLAIAACWGLAGRRFSVPKTTTENASRHKYRLSTPHPPRALPGQPRAQTVGIVAPLCVGVRAGALDGWPQRGNIFVRTERFRVQHTAKRTEPRCSAL